MKGLKLIVNIPCILSQDSVGSARLVSVDAGSSKNCSSMSWHSFSVFCRIFSLWWFKLLLHFVLIRGLIPMSSLVLVGALCDIDSMLIVECAVTSKSFSGFSIPSWLPKLVVKTDCDQAILWMDSLERLTPPI